MKTCKLEPRGFKPVCIVLETQEEVDTVRGLAQLVNGDPSFPGHQGGFVAGTPSDLMCRKIWAAVK
jgi:hypothetical protein